MKKKIIVALLFCLITLTSVFAFAGCYPTTDGANLEGFDIDLAKMVAKDLGVEARFRFITWNAKEMELKGKHIDLIWNGLTIDDGRLEQFCISTPYMNNKQIAVIKKSNADKYTDKDNIKDAKFSFEESSAGQDVASSEGFSAIHAECIHYKVNHPFLAICQGILRSFQKCESRIIDRIILKISEQVIYLRINRTMYPRPAIFPKNRSSI